MGIDEKHREKKTHGGDGEKNRRRVLGGEGHQDRWRPKKVVATSLGPKEVAGKKKRGHNRVQ